MASQPPSSSPLFGYGEAPTPAWLTPANPQLPATTFGENFSASVEEMEIAGNVGARERSFGEGYRPILQALTDAGEQWDGTVGGERGYASSGRHHYLNPYEGPGLGFNGVPDRNRMRDMIFERVRERRRRDPNFLPGVPDSADAFEAQVTARNAQRLQELRSVQSRATGFGQIGGFLGGMAGSLQDPVNIATLPIGGSARTVVGSIARVTVEQALLEAVMQPMVARNYQALGEDYGPGDEIRSVLFSGLAAGGFHAAGHAAGRAYDAILSHVFNALPEHVQRRWAGAATIDQVPLTDILRATVPPEAWTPDLRSAVHVMDRETEIADASPFERTAAGDQAHADGLTEALHRLTDTARSLDTAIPRGTAGEAQAFRPAPEATVSSPTAATDFKARVRRRESGGNDRAQNSQPGATASGRYQFTHGTFTSLHRQVFGGNMSAEERWSQRFDANVQERLMDAAISSYTRVLQRGGQAVTPGNLYLSHFFGPDDAVSILRHPDTPLADILRATHGEHYVNEVFRLNPNLRRDMRGADAAALTNRAMGGRAPERMAEGETASSPVANGSGDALDLEAQLAMRDSAEPIPEGHAVIAPTDAPPVLRRDLFDSSAEWERAQALVDNPASARPDAPAIASRGADGATSSDVQPYFRQLQTDIAELQAGRLPQWIEDRTTQIARTRPDQAEGARASMQAGLQKELPAMQARQEALRALPEDVANRMEAANVLVGDDGALRGYYVRDHSGNSLIWDPATGQGEYRRANLRRETPSRTKEMDPEDFAAEARRMLPEAASPAASRASHVDPLRSRLATSTASAALTERPALKRFDDPAGDASRATADSIHHDLKAAIAENPALAAQKFLVDEAGEEMTLDAILSELDGDRAAAAALRGCL